MTAVAARTVDAPQAFKRSRSSAGWTSKGGSGRGFLVATTLLLGLLSLLAFALASSQSKARRAVEERFGDQAETRAALTHSLFKSTVSASETTDARLYGTARVTAGALTAAARSEQSPDLVLLAQNGHVIASSADTSAIVINAIRAKPAFVSEVLAGAPFTLSDVMRLGRNKTVIQSAIAFNTPGGRRVLVSGFSPHELSSFIGGYLVGAADSSDGRAYVLDGNGAVIASAVNSAASTSSVTEPGLVSAASRGGQGPFRHGRYFVASPVQNSRWRVVLTEADRTVFASVSGASAWVPWLLFGAFAFVSILALALVARIVRKSVLQRESDARFRDALRETNLRLEAASQAKDRFLASMSHELRTPLNAILGFTGTILMELPGPLNDEQSKQLRTVQTSGRHLLSLINDMLDLAKIESGSAKPRVEPIDCQELLEEVAVGLRPLATEKGLELDVVAATGRLEVHTDRRALSQILINLVNNAIKFTDQGGARLQLSRYDRGQSSFTRFTVTDTGPGIKATDQGRLFAAFEQIDNSTTRASEGTGLGLYICQTLATFIGGAITFESEYGKGSAFTLELSE
jgi:signal transduction histidine kinase